MRAKGVIIFVCCAVLCPAGADKRLINCMSYTWRCVLGYKSSIISAASGAARGGSLTGHPEHLFFCTCSILPSIKTIFYTPDLLINTSSGKLLVLSQSSVRTDSVLESASRRNCSFWHLNIAPEVVTLHKPKPFF